jgi:hypothetical protein
MREKIIMVVSAVLMLANEILELGYEKVEITAAVALIATIVATAIGRLRSDAVADRMREKELDLELKNAELELLERPCDRCSAPE